MFNKKSKQIKTKAKKEKVVLPKPVAKMKKPLLYTNYGVAKEREYFVENLSLLVGSGMGILTVIDAIQQEVRTKKMKYVLSLMKEDIENGSTIWQALDKTKLFPEQTISLVRIGEETGKLMENLQVVAIQNEKERMFKSKIKSAMMYPIFVLSVTVLVGVGIAWFILPKLSLVFSDLKIDLPLITSILIQVGNYLGENGSWLMPIVLFFFFGTFYILFFFSKTKFIGQALLFKVPGVRNLILEVELARFGYVLGTLLEAGLPIVAALDSLHRSTAFPAYKKIYGHLRDRVEEGNSFQKCFILTPNSGKYMPIPIQQLIVAGEKSGKLSETLIKIGNRYESKTEITTKNLSTVLEPILLVIVWLGVVAVAMAVILPIYSLIGGLEAETSAPPPPPPAAAQVMQPTNPELEFEEAEVIVFQLKIMPTGLGYLNVRSGPGTSYSIVDQVEPGQIYQYLAISEDWYQIVLGENEESSENITGWVLDRYIELIEEVQLDEEAIQ